MATTRQEQSTEPSPRNEVTIFEHNSSPILDHDLPIALKKGTRECTKRPLYIHCLTLCLSRDFPLIIKASFQL